MKNFLITLLLMAVIASGAVCFSDDKEEYECTGQSATLNQTITGALSITDPVEGNYFYDTYCLNLTAGRNYAISVTATSSKRVYISAETEEGEEELFDTATSYSYIGTGIDGDVSLYISAYRTDVQSANVNYSFSITPVE